MATDQAQTSVPPTSQVQPLQAWWERLGLSGKILAIGAAVGVIGVFLPLLSMSTQLPSFGGKGGVQFSGLSSGQSVMVLSDWRGVLCLLGYLGAVALTFVLYPPNGLVQKTLGWAGLGVGAFVSLLALWLLAQALSGTGSAAGFGSFKISLGFGAILNLLAAGAVATGGFLKAREERLV